MNTVTLPDGPSLPRFAQGGMALSAPFGGRPAQTISGAWLETIRGMGHDLPRGAWPVLVNLIDDHIRAGAVTVRSADGQET